MAHVSLRVSEEEKNTIEAYAKLQGMSVSEAMKEAFFEKLEDEYDFKVIEEYERSKPQEVYSHDEVGKLLGIN